MTEGIHVAREPVDHHTAKALRVAFNTGEAIAIADLHARQGVYYSYPVT
jgi:hypothetical protein